MFRVFHAWIIWLYEAFCEILGRRYGNSTKSKCDKPTSTLSTTTQMDLSERLMQMSGTEVLSVDGWLEPYQGVLVNRWNHLKHKLWMIQSDHGGIMNFSSRSNYGIFVEVGNQRFPLTQIDKVPKGSEQPFLVYREWAGNARTASICGDFNNWDNHQWKSTSPEYGVHTIKIPFNKTPSGYECPIKDGQKYKIFLETYQGEQLWRQPLYCDHMVYNDDIKGLEPVFRTSSTFNFRFPQPDPNRVLKIYETHIGMAGEEPRVHTYKEFMDEVLPRIHKKGYNCIQIMAVQEHAYYASFGYQVTSFFAASSRFGDPDDLKRLVDRAHELGILVLLDLVHSHASKNEADGISRYDGSDFIFRPGDHPLWDSKVFNYDHIECLRYLLQNLRYWLEEFNVDGFRFDGCMSMMYWHRSAQGGYTGRYGEYFEDSSGVDEGALTYLRLSHLLFKYFEAENKKAIITIAEDVSGYPTLATPIELGGVGFTYRFQMAAPDLWVSMMKHGFDEGLNDGGNEAIDTGKILHALTNRRHQEKHIIYAECHDQACVGDKTLMMWLLNEKIYTNMSCLQEQEPRTKRGVALHKVIRVLTASLGGEGYLTFMGNEFGHPEWIDFPRAGNNWSFHHARRQWHLEDEDHTRYHQLGKFDEALMGLFNQLEWSRFSEYCTIHDDGRHLFAYDRGNLQAVVSLHHSTLNNIVIPVRFPGNYRLALHTESPQFGGFQDVRRVEANCSNMRARHHSELSEWDRNQLQGFEYALLIDEILCRSALLFVRE